MTESESQPDKKRLSFNQKFWLICICGPLFLIGIFLIVAIAVPKPLNPTEKKLLGTWQAVSPASIAGQSLTFDSDSAKSNGYPFLWSANESEISAYDLDEYEFWERIKLRLGLNFYDRLEIDNLTKKELKIRQQSTGDILIYKRIEPAQP